jgi:hypothetical protein
MDKGLQTFLIMLFLLFFCKIDNSIFPFRH